MSVFIHPPHSLDLSQIADHCFVAEALVCVPHCVLILKHLLIEFPKQPWSCQQFLHFIAGKVTVGYLSIALKVFACLVNDRTRTHLSVSAGLLPTSPQFPVLNYPGEQWLRTLWQ